MHTPLHQHPDQALAYRPDIDGLRAVAVLAVVLYHAKLGLFPGGYTGVDIFFVISGYLIASIIVAERARGQFTFARFYERRIRRIFPALFTVLIASAAIGWFVLAPGHYVSFSRSAMAAMAFYSNFFFNRQAGYFAPAAETQPLLHTWSLGVEEQFYLVAPFVVLALAGPLARWKGRVFWPLFALSLAVSVWGVWREESWAFYLPHARAYELMIGVAMAVGLLPATAGRYGAAAGWVGIALIACALFLFDAATPFPGLAALIPAVGAALVIMSGADRASPVARALATAPTVFVGKMSYSFYLWHWPLLAFAEYEWGSSLDWRHRVALIVLAFALSVASYYLIEQPARRNRTFLTRRTVFAGGAAALLVCLAVTEAINRSRGAPFRLAPEVAAFARATPTKIDVRGLCGFSADGEDGGDLCPIGLRTGQTRRFVLWGDSHAAALSAEIDRQAAARGLTGLNFGRGGCMPLFGLEAYGRAFRKCLSRPAQIEDVLKDPAITDVILHARWALYAEGEASANEANTRPRVFVDGDRAANRAAFAQLLRATVERLRKAGKRVTLLGPVPELDVDLPAALIKAKMRGRAMDFALPLDRFEQRQQTVLPLLRDLAQQPGVRVLYPHEILCDGKKCRTVADGRALYVDDDHLSPAGSAQLRGLIERALAPIQP